MTRITEHQQNGIKQKWESSSATEYCLKCNGQFNWLHFKAFSREERYRSRKIRKSLEIKRLKCDCSKSNVNHGDGNLVKTNMCILLLRKIKILKVLCGNKEALAV